jgi:cell division protein FtsB
VPESKFEPPEGGYYEPKVDRMSKARQEVGVIRRWTTSLAFWFSLLVAVLLYASVTLSPKALVYLEFRDSHHANQVQLVELEREVGHLEKTADALQHDPNFAAEMARIHFDAVRPGEERIPVDQKLHLDARVPAAAPASRVDRLTPYLPYLRTLAGDSSIRMSCLAAAATITIVAFTFFQTPSPAERHSEDRPDDSDSQPRNRRWRLLDRYRKQG